MKLKADVQIDGKEYVSVSTVVQYLDVSRQATYGMAKRYGWQSAKQNSRKYWLLADVASTPDAQQRKAERYAKAARTHKENYAAGINGLCAVNEQRISS